MIFKFLGMKCIFGCLKHNDEVFDKIDVDSNGKISLTEFHNYYTKKYGKPPSNDQWFRFHLADQNNDGYLTENDIMLFEQDNKLF